MPKDRRARRSRQPATTSPRPRIAGWLAEHRRLVLALIVVASIAERAIYFTELNATPFIELHRSEQTDMHYYDEWASRIAGGDWLSASLRLPMHQWQRNIAAQYFRDHPDERTRWTTTADAAHTRPEEALWAQWLHVPQFYQDPLYAYVIGLTYRLAGHDVRYVLVGQLVIGIVTNVLLWLLARRFFGDVVAAWTAVLAILNGPLVYYELILLRDSLNTFTGLGVVWLAVRAIDRRTWPRVLALGAALGVAYLLKSSFATLIVAAVIAVVVSYRRRWREGIAPLAALIAGVALAIAPLIIRNVAVGVTPMSMASAGPLTFVAANEPATDVSIGSSVNVPMLSSFLGESDGSWRSAWAAAVRDHGLWSYLGLIWRKFDRAWHWYEIPNNDNFYFMARQAPIVRWLPVTAAIVAPLALVGLVLGVRRLREAWPLYMLIAASLAPLLLFYVLGRYRMPMIAAALPLAALTIVSAARALGQRAFPTAALIVVAVAVLAAWTNRPLPPGQPVIRTGDWMTRFEVVNQEAIHDATGRADWAAAANEYENFFAHQPDLPDPTASGELEPTRQLAEMHLRCSSLWSAAGQADRAGRQMSGAVMAFQRILAASPADAEAHGILADSYANQQAFADAIPHYRAYLSVHPADGNEWIGLGIALIATGNAAEAAHAFRQAVAADPANAQFRVNLARALLDQGDTGAALDEAQRAVAAAPDEPAAHDVLARAFAARGALDAAWREFQRALQIDPKYAPAIDGLRELTRRR